MTEIDGIIERLKAARGDDGGSAIYADQDAIDDAIAALFTQAARVAELEGEVARLKEAVTSWRKAYWP